MTTPPRKRQLAKIAFALVLLLIVVAIALAIHRRNTSWDATPEAKARKNPLQPTPDNLKSAKAIYADKCANCHGDTGKGDGPDSMMYDPPPADLTDPKRMSAVTDGELFHKISQGKKPMPAFKKKLTEDQRWQLVLLVRSFPTHN
jgi:mono/diheme cytochrome c family protein